MCGIADWPGTQEKEGGLTQPGVNKAETKIQWTGLTDAVQCQRTRALPARHSQQRWCYGKSEDLAGGF